MNQTDEKTVLIDYFVFYFQSKVELMKSQRKQLEADLRKQVSLAQIVRI